MLKSQLQLCSTGWCHTPPFHEGSKEKPVQKGQEELRSSLALPSIGSDTGMQQEPDCKNTGQVSLAVTEPVSSSVKTGIMVPMGCPELQRIKCWDVAEYPDQIIKGKACSLLPGKMTPQIVSPRNLPTWLTGQAWSQLVSNYRQGI